eukprot:3979401-Prymnesium_polylepis.1
MSKNYPKFEVQIEGLGGVKSNYWKNTVTGDLHREYSTAGELLTPSNRSKSGIVRRRCPQITSPWPKLTHPVLPCPSQRP